MANSRLMKKLGLSAKQLKAKKASGENSVMDMMADPRYLRQSSSLIQDALQKGFDVLQLADGDIVTTGTKTIVYQYHWDAAKGKLVKSKSETGSKRSQRINIEEDESEDA